MSFTESNILFFGQNYLFNVSSVCYTALNFINYIKNVSFDFRRKNKSMKYVKKWTEKLWSHTSQNGLFVTVWPGDKNQNAFVGIALNKATPPPLP